MNNPLIKYTTQQLRVMEESGSCPFPMPIESIVKWAAYCEINERGGNGKSEREIELEDEIETLERNLEESRENTRASNYDRAAWMNKFDSLVDKIKAADTLEKIEQLRKSLA